MECPPEIAVDPGFAATGDRRTTDDGLPGSIHHLGYLSWIVLHKDDVQSDFLAGFCYKKEVDRFGFVCNNPCIRNNFQKVDEMPEFCIMNATDALHRKKKVGIEVVVSEMIGGAGVIFVCERERGAGDYQRIFLSSYGMEAAGTLPRQSSYTEDTGHGYRNKDKRLRILNVVQVATDGALTPANYIGVTEDLPHWVCK